MTASSATHQQRSPNDETPVLVGSPHAPLRVAVVVASRHGSTVGIAETIRAQLADAGLRAQLFVADQFSSFEGADAVVLGSAVYAGRWLKAAQELLDQRRTELSKLPVWLFSSGPVGDDPMAGAELPPSVVRLAAEIGARDNHMFAGKLDHDVLGFGERSLVKAIRAPQGDFRDWDEIKSWADGIADALTGPAVAEAAGPYIQAAPTV